MLRVCNLYLLLACLHGFSAYLAGAWQHQEGSIVRQLLMPELVFWQTVTHKGSKTAFDPGGDAGTNPFLDMLLPYSPPQRPLFQRILKYPSECAAVLCKRSDMQRAQP